MTEKVQGQIRHLLTAGGGVLVALGLMSEEEATGIANATMAVVGAASTLIGAFWSWWSKQ